MKRQTFGRRAMVLGGVAAASAWAAASGLASGPARPRLMPAQTANSAFDQASRSFGDGAMCVATDAAVEGPYYLDDMLVRSDIRDGKEGAVLDLELRIVDAASCRPEGRPKVDIWHCDALGVYSRFAPRDPGAPRRRGAPALPTGDDQSLRGRQIADRNGFVKFRTVYPGWYGERTTHIHGKIWTGPSRAFTFQMYFPDSLNGEIARRPPYSRRPPSRHSNGNDMVIRWSGGGDGSFLKMSRAGDGFRGTLTVGVPPS